VTDNQERIAQLNNEIDDLTRHLDEAENYSMLIRREIYELEADLDALECDLSETNAEVNTVKAAIDVLKAQLNFVDPDQTVML
jgi:chromosome segregation ATPase